MIMNSKEYFYTNDKKTNERIIPIIEAIINDQNMKKML